MPRQRMTSEERRAAEIESARQTVLRTRAAQGLPPTIEDPATLSRVAEILRLAEANTVRAAS